MTLRGATTGTVVTSTLPPASTGPAMGHLGHRPSLCAPANLPSAGLVQFHSIQDVMVSALYASSELAAWKLYAEERVAIANEPVRLQGHRLVVQFNPFQVGGGTVDAYDEATGAFDNHGIRIGWNLECPRSGCRALEMTIKEPNQAFVYEGIALVGPSSRGVQTDFFECRPGTEHLPHPGGNFGIVHGLMAQGF